MTDKIRKQMQHLEQRNYTVQVDLLQRYVLELQLGDSTNREGHAAKVYFNALFGMDFSRSDDSAVNGALNYGYGILLACFNREIVANGYLTQLGLFHENMFNPFNLASDFMEPFRILIDKKVVEMQPKKLEHAEKMELLTILQQEVLIDGKQQCVNNAIKIYCRSLLEALNERDISCICFYQDGEERI